MARSRKERKERRENWSRQGDGSVIQMILVFDNFIMGTRIISPTGLAPAADGEVMRTITTDVKGTITDRLVSGDGVENECLRLVGLGKCV
jgi:hypothetical protein